MLRYLYHRLRSQDSFVSSVKTACCRSFRDQKVLDKPADNNTIFQMKRGLGTAKQVASGCFGSIYAWEDSDAVLKVARLQRREEADTIYQKLEREERFLLAAKTHSQGTMIQVPQSYGVYRNGLGVEAEGPFLAMQKIPFIPQEVEDKLRKVYYPGRWLGKPRKLWRVYMGLDMLPQEAAFFGAEDYPLMCREAEAVLRLPMAELARDMGRFLARLTFAGGWLPNDVEFVVAGSRCHDQVQVFCLDFEGLCTHTGKVEEITNGLYGSDPYYPQREDRYRDDFAAGYVGEAVLLGHGEVAAVVMSDLHARWLSDRCKLRL